MKLVELMIPFSLYTDSDGSLGFAEDAGWQLRRVHILAYGGILPKFSDFNLIFIGRAPHLCGTWSA